METEVIEMSVKYVSRREVMALLKSKALTQIEGAKRFNMSTRQLRQVHCMMMFGYGLNINRRVVHLKSTTVLIK
jgi:hypothetical protein